jgi:hypothetical protein
MRSCALVAFFILSLTPLVAFKANNFGVVRVSPSAGVQVSRLGASANELSISGGGDKEGTGRDGVLLPPLDLIGLEEEDDDLDEDALFEREMAQSMFDMLRGDNEELPVEAFLEWDDIRDVLDLEIIDTETMALIIESCGVSDSMTFTQWLDAVELVNQVQLTLEGAGDEQVSLWDPIEEQRRMDESERSGRDRDSEVGDQVQLMLEAFGLKPNPHLEGEAL